MDNIEAHTLPLRAMTRLLAEMQTSIVARAMPQFGGSIDRFMIYVLVLGLTLRRGGAATPILAIAQSLSIAFETTRRHLARLTADGLCHRQRGGVVATDAWRKNGDIHALAVLAHDSLVRFIAGMQSVGACTNEGGRNQHYEWTSGLRIAIDLMLAVADGNRQAHADNLELVLFSTVYCANSQLILADAALSRDYALPSRELPAQLIQPVSAATAAAMIALPRSTVSRRLRDMAGRSLVRTARGYIVSSSWFEHHHALSTSATSFANVRRLLTALEGQGFPFAKPHQAYVGAPPSRPSA